jgi:hypothetical protein
MSDGHSDAMRYSKFYSGNAEAKARNEQQKLEKMCLVLGDGSVVKLQGVQLMFSEKYNNDLKSATLDMLTEDGSRMMNLTELIRTLIKTGAV